MKSLSFLLLALTTLSVNAAENRKLICDLTSDEQIILPAPSHRLIFVAKTAELEIREDKIAVSLIGKISWNFEIAIKTQSASKILAKNSERVYPSGSVARSYVIEESVKLSDLDTASPKLVVKSEEKKFFKGELKYLGEYRCQDI